MAIKTYQELKDLDIDLLAGINYSLPGSSTTHAHADVYDIEFSPKAP
jgi:hypothetical protein